MKSSFMEHKDPLSYTVDAIAVDNLLTQGI